MTFGEYASDYFKQKELFVKKSTFFAYRQIWYTHLRSRFENVDMDSFRPSHLQQFVNQELLDGKARHTVQDHYVVIKNMLALYYESTDRYAPVIKIRWPAQSARQEREIRPFSDSELKTIFKDIQDGADKRKWLFAIMFTTGVRIGEMCGVRYSDCDFKDRSIHIQRTVQRIYDPETKESELLVTPPKTKSSDRFIYPPKWVMDFWKVMSQLHKPDTPLLTGERSSEICEPRTLRQFYKAWLTSLGIPYRNPHQARHTVATRLIEKGVDVSTAAAILGHTNATTTLNTYAHTSEDRKKKAARKIDLISE